MRVGSVGAALSNGSPATEGTAVVPMSSASTGGHSKKQVHSTDAGGRLMRRLLFQMMVSVDGSMAGPDGELDWHIVDEDFSGYVDRMLRSIDAILLGRRTYEGLAQYWPDAREPEAPLMNDLPKIVFSSTLRETDWANSRIVSDDPVREVSGLKARSGKDLAVFASATLAATLADAGLIDEYRIIVSPVLLGRGRPVLPGLAKRVPLRLARTEELASGTVCLFYEPA
jgi:dihydrofolate reductase